MAITSLITEDFYADIGTPETAPSFGVDWEDPSDWLNWLETGADLPSYSMPTDINTQDWAPGIQTTMWDVTYGGVGLSPDATGEELAAWIAGQSFTAPAGGNQQDAVDWFASEYGQLFGFLSFDANFGGTLTGLEEEYAMKEADMWELYENWQSGELSLLEDSFGTMSETFDEQLTDIDTSKKDQLSNIIAGRRQAERGIGEQITAQRRAMGRTGFGTSHRLRRQQEEAELRLSGMTQSAFDIKEGARISEDTLLGDYATEAEIDAGGYISGQESQMLGMEGNLALWQLQFKNQAETMYNTWAQGIYSQVGNMLLQTDPEHFGTLGGTSEGWIFDPMGTYVPDCPIGTVMNANGNCEEVGIPWEDPCPTDSYEDEDGNCIPSVGFEQDEPGDDPEEEVCYNMWGQPTSCCSIIDQIMGNCD